MTALTVGSLFSGIGGIDLGLERAGMRIAWQAETDPYASRVLAKHWPDTPNLGDVTTIDWSKIERPDLVCGGFPCQPVSLAGRRLAQLDARWLWPEFARAVRLVQPRYVLVENVPGLLVRGMGDVLGDLAALGYDCEWAGIPAAAVGAPHLRWRIFIVAHTDGVECDRSPNILRSRKLDAARSGQGVKRRGYCSSPMVPHAEVFAERPGLCPDEPAGSGCGRLSHLRGPDRIEPCKGCGEDWCHWHSLHRDECGCADPWDESEDPEFGWWAAEPELGRVAHGIPARVDRLRCLGNAVVPQVAEWLGRRLLDSQLDVDRVDERRLPVSVGVGGDPHGVAFGSRLDDDFGVLVAKDGDSVTVHPQDHDSPLWDVNPGASS